ncbi:hypothetical protein CCAL9344_02095 [Campylobacter sp. RM9344]|uniref:Uncharacterized protein n=1 Tax=Campylobacter californiensis TaxID=1032243 RepID=A0AAW3ZUZ8_9BACT|nr:MULTISPECIES: hypothetical protein [unclassified Campylobacter]MBE2984641.1 hypothetical protein [Campylobacter sp. RM6883]MBE2995071.1 hypothetical protein [Campylobacter sp. RM6913]MBE3028992.1 hypothetical protein [Campylobacter sp. RM9344]MBE3607349.1 hypothetical protein [Campylobacter sp. RM9337]
MTKVVYDELSELVSVEYFPYKVREFEKFYLTNINFSYAKKYLNRLNINKAKGKKDKIIMIKNDQILDTSIANIAIFANNLG